MTVDLNTCVPGQKCVNKNGNYLTYLRKINNNPRYHHLLLSESSSEESYTNDGIYDLGYPDTTYNIVRIIPMESTTPDKHPSIAWWESCPWITDRKPMKEDGNQYGFVLATCSTYQTASLVNWDSVSLTMPWIHSCNWQPPVLSNKEQALELLNKHEGGWCPTPKEWTIIRKGLEG